MSRSRRNRIRPGGNRRAKHGYPRALRRTSPRLLQGPNQRRADERGWPPLLFPAQGDQRNQLSDATRTHYEGAIAVSKVGSLDGAAGHGQWLDDSSSCRGKAIGKTTGRSLAGEDELRPRPSQGPPVGTAGRTASPAGGADPAAVEGHRGHQIAERKRPHTLADGHDLPGILVPSIVPTGIRSGR